MSCRAVRLVGGSSSLEGRVEIYLNNQWGTVCDDEWTLPDARVVCQQLGLGPALQARSGASFGQGTGQIHLDDVQCDGDESTLSDCTHRGVGVHNCGHSEDAGVVCSQPGKLSFLFFFFIRYRPTIGKME